MAHKLKDKTVTIKQQKDEKFKIYNNHINFHININK